MQPLTLNWNQSELSNLIDFALSLSSFATALDCLLNSSGKTLYLQFSFDEKSYSDESESQLLSFTTISRTLFFFFRRLMRFGIALIAKLLMILLTLNLNHFHKAKTKAAAVKKIALQKGKPFCNAFTCKDERWMKWVAALSIWEITVLNTLKPLHIFPPQRASSRDDAARLSLKHCEQFVFSERIETFRYWQLNCVL